MSPPERPSTTERPHRGCQCSERCECGSSQRDGPLEPNMRGPVPEYAGPRERQGIGQPFAFLHGISRPHRIPLQAVHNAGIVPPMPMNVQSTSKTAGPAKISKQNCAAGPCKSSYFGKQLFGLAQMMENRVAQDQIEAAIRKRETVSVRHLEMDAGGELTTLGCEIRLRLSDHPRRAVHSDEFPLLQAPCDFGHNLSGARADIEGRSSLAPIDELQRVFDQSVVHRIEIGLGSCRGIGLDLA